MSSRQIAVGYELWLTNSAPRLARAQFVAHQTGVAAMVIGLYELYGRSAPIRVLEPVLALASTTVLTAAILMLILVVRVSLTPAIRAAAVPHA